MAVEKASKLNILELALCLKRKLGFLLEEKNMKEIVVRRGITEILPILNYLDDKKAFICGGYARYCLSPHKTPVEAIDVDIYCEDEETFQKIKLDLSQSGVEVRFENNMAITYKQPIEGIFSYCPVLQLIKPIKEGKVVSIGDVNTVLENFDFTVIRCAIIKKDGKYIGIADDDFEEDEKNKFLRIKNIHCPISSTLRFMKYARKGYFTRPMQIVSLFVDWDNRGDDYKAKIVDTLKEIQGGKELTQDEIDNLEALMRID